MSQPLIGAPRNRVDGPAKVTGAARYAGDNALDGMLHAVVVASTIAHGRIAGIDEGAARRAEGVIEIFTHENAPRLNARKESANESLAFVLQDDRVTFDRQPVALVVAQTFEQATYAAGLVRVTYDGQAPLTRLEAGERFTPQEVAGGAASRRRGDPQAVYSTAAVRLLREYRTPTEHHNPMEVHSTAAVWDADHLVLYDSTQWAFGVQQRIAAMFGMQPERVRVVAPFVGGAFGCKGQTWSHVALAAMAARVLGRPVKLILTRPQMFGWVGHRPQTHQTIALGATREGRLVSASHEVLNETSVLDEFVEPSAVFSRDLYAVPNFAMSHTLSRLHISKPTYQRGPGESTGSFAMESAMDELSYALEIDPLALRLRNYAEAHPDSGKPYSSKQLRECYRRAAERFGWSRRSAPARSMRRGDSLVGFGMASASRATHRSTANARIRMNPDGNVLIQCGTIEQGTGSTTVYGQLAAEILGIPFERVRFEWGDTTLPFAPLAAGSQTSGSVGSVVAVAARRLRDRLASDGGPVRAPVELDVEDGPSEAEEAYATQAFGAHFCEVEVDPDLGTVRVVRHVAAFDGGRILNAKTATSQFLGGIVWGISMALFEHTRYDQRTGRIMNANLSEYLIPTNADIPDADIILVESDDQHANPAGVKGIGEIGISGSAAAVANAVFHATGVRVRELPITPEKLIV